MKNFENVKTMIISR